MDVEKPRGHSFRSFIRPKLNVSAPVGIAAEEAAVETQVCSCGKGFIELYCHGDNELICMPCYYGLHGRCKAQSVKQLSQEILQTRELDTLIKEMEVLKAAIGRVLGDKNQLTVYRRQQKKSLIKHTKNLNIRHGLEKLGKEVRHKVGALQDSLHVQQLMHRQKCRRAIREINNHLKNLAHFSEHGNRTGTYIEMHKSKEDMASYMDILNELSNVTNEDHIIDDNVTNLVSDYFTRDNLGSVMVSRSPGKGSSSRSSSLRSSRISNWASIDRFRLSDNQSHVNRVRGVSSYTLPERTNLQTGTSAATSLRVRQPSSSVVNSTAHTDMPIVKFALKQFSSKTEDDDFVNYVSAIEFLVDGRILVLDCRNNKLKLFSMYYKFLWVLDMVRSVWDMTFTNENEILITCPSDGRLQHVQITNENVLFKTGHISTMKDCRAICLVGEMLYVSYSGENPCIRILSIDGIMYRAIPPTYNSKRIMQNPLYMLVKEKGNLIYISDYSLQQVCVMDQRGTLFHCHDVKPGWPLGMTMDKDGNVIVSVSGTRNIRMLMKDNSSMGILVHPNVFQEDPSTVAFDKENNMLYVAFENQNDLRMLYII